MAVTEERYLGNLAEQPEPQVEATPNLRLLPGGIVEVVPVPEKKMGPGLARVLEELEDSVQAQKNVAFLHQREIDFAFPDDSSVQITLGKVIEGQGSVASALLYGLERTGLRDFPGGAHVARSDISDRLEAIDLFLQAWESRGEAALEIGDGKLAIGYKYSVDKRHERGWGAVFIENINGSERKDLDGTPEQLLKEVLTSYDLKAETDEIEQLLAGERARRRKHPAAQVS